MADNKLHLVVRCHLAWWVRPYLWLTFIGVRLGLPINPETVCRDVMRGTTLSIEADHG